MVRYLGQFPKHDLTVSDVCAGLVRLLLDIGAAMAPMILGVLVIGFVSNVAQVGFKFSSKSLQVKGTRLNPLQGFVSMFSSRALVELAKSLAKISVIGYIIYSFLKSKEAEIAALVGGSYFMTCKSIGQLTFQLLLRATAALLVIAALDYTYQRFSHEKRLKMTKQEVRDDMKRSEGDPQIKGKIRARQREVAQRRMMA
jgi:flagellar biosynthetic protein FlhB